MDSSFILSSYINGCYSKYPVNIASMKYISKYYSTDDKIKQLIDHKFPSQIISILNKNNNKFGLLCTGYIRKFNTKYIIPKDVINIINRLCIIKCFADLQNEGLIVLTNIIISDILTTKHTDYLFRKGIIDILMKLMHKTSFLIMSRITWSLKHIAEKLLNLKNENAISIFENQIYKSIKIIRLHFFAELSLPSIEQLIKSNILPLLRQLSLQTDHLRLQYQSLWTLLNIAACDSEYIGCIVDSNNNIYIKTLISALQSPYYQIKEQALWALGNIAGDVSDLKDLLLNNDILANIFLICNSKFDKKYVTNFNNSSHVNNKPILQFINLLATCSWTLANLCRGSPPPNLYRLYDLIKCLQCLLKQTLLIRDDNGKKHEIIQNIAWSFSYLTEYKNDEYNHELINKMEELGIIKQFINLMCHKYGPVRHPLNRMFGNILTGSDENTQKCLDLGILSKYTYILSSQSEQREQREICWSLSNILYATDNDRNKLLVMEHGLFKILINILQNQNTNYGTSKDAMWAISNGTASRNKKIINHLVENGVQKASMSFFKKCETHFTKSKNENTVLLVALECIENILIVGQQNQRVGDNINKFSYLFEECGIVTFLKDLQTDEEKKKNINERVYQKCVNIIEIYFHDEEIIDNDNQKQQQ